MGKIQFWLSQGKVRLQLPVNPESITVDSPFGYEDITVPKLGEFTVINERMPRTFSLESFFPRDYNAVYCEYTKIPKPADAVAKIEKFRSNKKPVKLSITGTKVNFAVTIREFEYEPERAGNPGDIYFSMSLKEYKTSNISMIKKKKASASKKRPTSSKSGTQKTYTVVKGDSLWKIAAKKSVYGNGAKWTLIYNANKKIIGKNPNLIYPGQKLVIPND
ncbi:LysM peptidoglycan-binding domain-containing protein [Neobacillus mesonae]|uniref:LysM peptidoglycan-binding domain-containing protein n=1 Tax=Neobacillus mesonae TaxID=1193713 RepID=UPI001FD354E2|nr:LysM peptidoglycan-binding domain-containing protein [Neobacillus mesonae]